MTAIFCLREVRLVRVRIDAVDSLHMSHCWRASFLKLVLLDERTRGGRNRPNKNEEPTHRFQERLRHEAVLYLLHKCCDV